MGTIILNPYEIFAADVIPRNGLVAEYLANNNFLDTSGNGFNGVNNNVTFGDDRHGNPNSAFVLNGTDAWVYIDAALAGLATTTEGTWSAWVKPVDATPSDFTRIIGFGTSNKNELLATYIDNNPAGSYGAQGRENDGVNTFDVQTDDAPVFADNTWTHTAIVQNGTLCKLYIDGVFIDQTFFFSLDTTTWFNSIPLLNRGIIGAIRFNNTLVQFFNGSIDDIRFYNRDLSQAEITILANE